MYTGNNPSALRSQKWLAEALLALMDEKEYNKITIIELASKSDLSRQTFYQLFNSKEEIIEYYLDILFQEYLKQLEKIRYIGIKELTYLLLKFYKMNEKFINHMIDNHLTDILNQVFKRDLILLKEALHAPSYINPYLSDFIASGLVGLLTCYRHDQSSSIEDIAVLIDSIFDKNNIDKI